MQDQDTNWYDPDVATFGDRLAAARDAAGLSQAAFAKRLGVKASTIRKWEEDLAEPRANRLSMMAGLLGVTITWLITGQGEGLDRPEADPLSEDLKGLLTELRDLRFSFSAKAEQVGRIEKRLRTLMQDENIG